MRTVRRTAVAASIVVAATLGTTRAAVAAPGDLNTIKAAAASAISQRQNALSDAITKVTANKYLTAPHKATILSTLNTDKSGLNALASTIAADTEIATARADSKKIFTDYRVYAVALPQAHFAAAADALTDSALPHLLSAYNKLAAALAGPAKSKNTPELQAALNDMAGKISDAQGVLGGVADHVLAVTPADYNSNQAVMSPFRSAIEQAQADVKAARSDGQEIVEAIK